MKNRRAFIKYISSLLLFGLNGIVAKHISLSSYEIVLTRTFFGSIFLAVLFLMNKGRLNIKENKKDIISVALSGIAMGISWMFLYEGFARVGVSLASLLYYCGPVIMMAFSPLIFHEKLTAAKLLGFSSVVAGIFLVNGTAIKEGADLWGILCGIMSAVTYFFMVVLNKRSDKISGLANTLIQLASAFVTVAAFLLIKQGASLDIARGDWGWILLLGLVNTGFGCYLYFSSLSSLKVQTVAVFSYLEAVSALVFAAILLGERMSLVQIAGAVLIIGGAIFAETVKGKE